MTSESTPTASPPKTSLVLTIVTWVGRAISLLCVAALSMSGILKIQQPQWLLDDFAKFKYPEGVLFPIGIAELVGVVLYAIPQTSVLGAIWLTGYLGGAVATHVHAGDGDFAGPIILGVLVWLGLVLRDPKLRAILPWRF
ncbi:MAG: DoxX family protein [Pirellulaceae bacterium]|nr:DoxX family protein [Pirellulaceae bacterium]